MVKVESLFSCQNGAETVAKVFKKDSSEKSSKDPPNLVLAHCYEHNDKRHFFKQAHKQHKQNKTLSYLMYKLSIKVQSIVIILFQVLPSHATC